MRCDNPIRRKRLSEERERETVPEVEEVETEQPMTSKNNEVGDNAK